MEGPSEHHHPQFARPRGRRVHRRRLDDVDAFFAEHGFAIIRGLYTEEQLQELEIELERQQQRLLVGELPTKCGTVILDDPDAVIDGEAFAHYVCHVTEVSDIARDRGAAPRDRRR